MKKLNKKNVQDFQAVKLVAADLKKVKGGIIIQDAVEV